MKKELKKYINALVSKNYIKGKGENYAIIEDNISLYFTLKIAIKNQLNKHLS